MTGSGHSFSDVAITDDILLGPDHLRESLPLDARSLRTDVPKKPGRHLVRVQCGATIRQLNSRTWKAGLALQNLGGYDGQTIVGAAITGTHGSGLAYGPIASQIVSLQMVGVGGSLTQLEPSRGITNPRTFVERLPEDTEVPVRLVQDDDAFDAATVSMGCLGVVYAVTLEVEKRFWIRERRTLTTWSALTVPGGFVHELVATGRPPARKGEGPPDHYEVYLSPYSKKPGEQTALLTERWRLDREPRRNAEDRQRGRAYTSIATALGLLADRVGVAADLFDRKPEEGPKFVETALRGLRDESYVDRGYEVFNLGAANAARVIGVELAFDLSQTIDAVATFFGIAGRERHLGRTHSIPISLRFVGPSTAFLAMQYGRPTMMMEIGMLSGVNWAEAMLSEYSHAFLSGFAARPHWGLDLGTIRDTSTLAALYPAWPKWRAAYHAMNPHGTFDGNFTDRIGLSSRG